MGLNDVIYLHYNIIEEILVKILFLNFWGRIKHFGIFLVKNTHFMLKDNYKS